MATNDLSQAEMNRAAVKESASPSADSTPSVSMFSSQPTTGPNLTSQTNSGSSVPVVVVSAQNTPIGLLEKRIELWRNIGIAAGVFALLSLFFPWFSVWGEGIAYTEIGDLGFTLMLLLICSVGIFYFTVKERPALVTGLYVLYLVIAFWSVSTLSRFLTMNADIGLYICFFACILGIVGATIQRFAKERIALLRKSAPKNDVSVASSSSGQRSVKICTHCGIQVPVDQNFCTNCSSDEFVLIPLNSSDSKGQ